MPISFTAIHRRLRDSLAGALWPLALPATRCAFAHATYFVAWESHVASDYTGNGSSMATRPKNDSYRMVAEYAAMPFTLAACMFIGWAAGYGLDRLFGTSYLYLVFLILGIAAGLTQVIRQIQRDTNASGK